LDGGGHNYRDGQIHDQTRSEFLARQGAVVLRFWNHQVREERDSVLRSILAYIAGAVLNETLTLILSVAKGRGDLHMLLLQR
jgi:very-short-patch-repair endonuclease